MNLRKLLDFPGEKPPVALPSRQFPNKEGEYTWEDYYEKNKELYPVRYFIKVSLIPWFKYSVGGRISHFFYFLRSHLQPSRRYHMLDLRQKRFKDGYQWGWIDADCQMENALVNIFLKYVEVEEPIVARLQSLQSLPMDPFMGDWHTQALKDAEDMYALWVYWTVTLPSKQLEHRRLLSVWYNNGKPFKVDSPEHEDAENYKKLMEAEREEKLIGILRLRHQMWT